MKNFKFNKLVYFFKIVIRVCFWYFFKKYVIEYYVVCFLVNLNGLLIINWKLLVSYMYVFILCYFGEML